MKNDAKPTADATNALDSDVQDTSNSVVKADADPAIERAAAAEFDDAPDSAKMRALLKKALPKEEAAPDGEILEGVQEKIRKRSGGKFYGDGWSRTQGRYTFLWIAVIMLIVLALCFAVTSPLAFGH
jgi:hypothetical protein